MRKEVREGSKFTFQKYRSTLHEQTSFTTRTHIASFAILKYLTLNKISFSARVSYSLPVSDLVADECLFKI